MAKRRKKGKPSGYQPNTNKRSGVSAHGAREDLYESMARELKQRGVAQNSEALIVATNHFIKHPEAVLTMWVPQLRAMDLQCRMQYGMPLFPGFDFNDAEAVAAVFTPLVKAFAELKQAGKSARNNAAVVAEGIAPLIANLAKFGQ